MRKNNALALLLSATMAATLAAPVAAQPLRAAPGGLSAAAVAPDEVQYRPRPRPGVRPVPPRRWVGPRPGYHPRWGRPYWRNGGWYYNNNGAWVGAAVAGLALGAAAAAAANSNNSGYGDPVAYCMSRFKSYNPRTGTYTGYDGRQHPCP
jgi:hypothetical protein